MIYRTVKYLETGELMGEPSVVKKWMYVFFIWIVLIALKDEKVAVREMRKHAAWYLKGIRGNAKVRNAINECNTREDLVTILNAFVEEIEAKNKVQVIC